MTELALNEHILVRKRYTRCCWMDFVRHAIIWVVSCVFITGNSPASAATVQDPVIAIHNADMEMNQGRYMEALSILQETIETFDNAGDSVDDWIRQRAYLLSGNIYLAYNDFVEALAYYEKALSYPVGDNDLRLFLLQNITVASCFTNNKNRAEEANRELTLLTVPDSLFHKRRYDYAIGRAFIEKYFGSSRNAASNFRRSLEIVDSTGLNRRELATPLSELYEYYDRIGDADSALYYLVRYDALAQEFLIPQMMADSRRGLLRTYIKFGDKEKALKAYESYFDIMDSLYRPALFISLNSKFQRNTLERANEKIENLEIKISAQNMTVFILVSIISVIIIILCVNKYISRLKKVIFSKNQEIVKLEETAGISSDNSRDREMMDKIEDALSDGSLLFDPNLGLDALARAIGSNSKYVSSAINRSKGMNFRSFINKLRIDEARKRLVDEDGYGHLTIESVGESVGFRSNSNFITAFRQVTGLTPSVYLKMAREERQHNTAPK